MPDTFQHVANLQASERRFHPRQQVLYSHMLLDDDNGGVVLNISESGLAMSAVRSVTKDPFRMRFQLSESNVWIEVRGRIAWTNASRQTAGVQFLGLAYEERIQIKRWLSSIDRLSATMKNPPAEGIAPAELASTVSIPEPAAPPRVIEDSTEVATPKGLPISDAAEDVEIGSQYFGADVDAHGYTPIAEIEREESESAASQSANRAFAPQLEASEPLVEKPEQDSAATNQAQVLPGTSEARDFETDSPQSRETSAMPAPAEKTRPDTHPPLYLSYEEAPPSRAKVDRELAGSPRHSRLWPGILLVVLVLLAFVLVGRYVRRAQPNKQSVEVPATAPQPASPPSASVTPTNPPLSADLKQPLDRPGFLLQVGAMTHKDNADTLAEALRKKNFPAFVSHVENDHFYFVFVGPYSDADSVLKAKTDLKKDGFEAIRMQRNP